MQHLVKYFFLFVVTNRSPSILFQMLDYFSSQLTLFSLKMVFQLQFDYFNVWCFWALCYRTFRKLLLIIPYCVFYFVSEVCWLECILDLLEHYILESSLLNPAFHRANLLPVWLTCFQ